MKRLLLSACAVATLSVSAPAAAQSGVLGDVFRGIFGSNSSNQIGNYDEQIRIAYQRREISQSEASDLQRRYYELQRLEQQYRQNGLSRDERYDLERRVNDFQRRFEMARSNGGYNDDDQWGNNDGRRCPPGLAKKRNGCLPPGQVGREDGRYRDSNGYREGYDYRDSDRYVWQRDRNGRIVQIDRRTGQVVSTRNR
ncbi:hypothetical protein ACWPM1_12940 [Tsuneonella sp. HG249]